LSKSGLITHGAAMVSARTVWITGGTKGIGLGLVQAFCGAGYQVFTCARQAPETPLPKGVVFHAADLRDPDQVAACVAACIDQFGSLDVLINNAGGSPMVAAAQASPRFSEAIIKLNLLAPLYCATQAQAVMADQEEGGVVINIASVSGLRASPGTAAYGAAKAGLINLTQSLAVEWAPKVRVNAIALGMVATESAQDHYGEAEAQQRVAASVPLQRLAHADDAADLCLFLAGAGARYMSGACIPLHGGGEVPAFLGAAGLKTP
jgi:NAD(P)-dependent dehydrogenase (short-subunit alcohol dehydrogenase family)